MVHPEDDVLLKRFHSPTSSEMGFNGIVLKYQERLYLYIHRMLSNHDDTNDVLQMVLIKAWKGLPKFREDANLYTWLYRIATNETYTFIKKKRPTIALDDAAHEKLSGEVSGNDLSGEAIEALLQDAIESLPEKQRAVFVMRYFEEKKYTEMSEILGTSVGALKASYHHAVKKIEKKITGN